jgi:hypothetical protein
MKEVQNYLSKINQRYMMGISREPNYCKALKALLEILLPDVFDVSTENRTHG